MQIVKIYAFSNFFQWLEYTPPLWYNIHIKNIFRMGDKMEFVTESSRIYSMDGEKLLAEITFPETEKGIFCIDHTFVDDSLRGQGIAGKLMELAVKEIESRDGKITATCSYAQHWLEKNR